MSGAIHSPITALSLTARRTLRIRRILDGRFSLSALEEWKRNHPEWWNSTRNAMGRGLYGEAMRELRRLEAATEDELEAELAAIA
jgi:hypothetical protein